jgi:hypothetical protein
LRGKAEQAKFLGDFVKVAHEKLTEAARLFDLPEHRIGQLLAPSVRTLVSAGSDLLAHRRHALAPVFCRSWMRGVVRPVAAEPSMPRFSSASTEQ